MHRGSSKAARGSSPEAENLPLSAPTLVVEVEILRGGRSLVRQVQIARGGTIRECVREVGVAPEGSVVLLDGHSVPLDLPVEGILRIQVLPTFSGG